MMKGKCLVSLSVLFLFLFPGLVSARNLNVLLPGLLNEHERIKAAEARRDSAMHQLREAMGGWYPKVDLTVQGGQEWTRQATNTTTVDFKNNESLRATQLLTDFGLTQSAVDRAGEVLEHAKAALDAIRQDVMLEGIMAYLYIIRAREKLHYARQSEKNIKEQTGMEEALVERGAGLSSDVLQTKSQLAGARALRVSVEGELAIAKHRFKTVYKKDPTGEEIKAFAIPQLPSIKIPETLPEAIETAMENNPQVIMSQYTIKITDHEVDARKARYYPRLNLYSEANRKMDDVGVPGDRLDAVVGMELTYNLYNGGADKAGVMAALSNITAAQNGLVETKYIVEERVKNAWQNHLTSREQHKFLENQANIMGEFLELARKERKLGHRTLLDVLTGEVNYINSVSLSVTARIDTIVAAYNILYAMGQLKLDAF